MDQSRKDWNDIKSNDSWSIFKIMSEFVEAYDRMAKIGPCVSIFGSARTKPDNYYYVQAEKLAERNCQPAVFTSANIAGGDEHNHTLIQQFQSRVKAL